MAKGCTHLRELGRRRVRSLDDFAVDCRADLEVLTWDLQTQMLLRRELERKLDGHLAHRLFREQLELTPLVHVESELGRQGRCVARCDRVRVQFANVAFLISSNEQEDSDRLVSEGARLKSYRKNIRSLVSKTTYIQHAVSVHPRVVLLEEVRAVTARRHHEVRNAARVKAHVWRQIVHLIEA